MADENPTATPAVSPVAPAPPPKAPRRSKADKKDEAKNAPSPRKVDKQDQPMSLPEVVAQQGGEGADPKARGKAGSDKGNAKKVTALHQLVHNGEEFGPGAELTLSASEVTALLAARVVIDEVGDKAYPHVERANQARSASLPGYTPAVELPTNPGEQFTDKPVK